MAYPAQTRELDEDEDDQPLVRSDCNADSEEEDDKPLVQSTSIKESVGERRHRCEEEKGPQSGGIHLPHWNRIRQELRVSTQMSRMSAKIQTVVSSRTLSKKWMDLSNLKDLHLQHYHMSSAQFKKRTTHLDMPGNVYDLYQHVVKTCPFCNSTKPRPDRSRASGLRAGEFGESWIDKHWRQNLWIPYCLGWSDVTFNSIPM